MSAGVHVVTSVIYAMPSSNKHTDTYTHTHTCCKKATAWKGHIPYLFTLHYLCIYVQNKSYRKDNVPVDMGR